MEKKINATPKIAQTVEKVVTLLEPFGSDERQRILTASLTILGDAPRHGASTGGGSGGVGLSDTADPTVIGLSAKGKTWIKQNALTLGQVEQVFDISNQGVNVIASEAPGRGKRELTRNAYVLLGISSLLASGEPAFGDSDARKLCEGFGCYDQPNHAAYMNDKGNLLTGSKATGWRLTAPGLKHGAELVRQLAKKE